MSSTVFLSVDSERTDISITKFARGGGSYGYQVTWNSSDKEQLFSYVSFEDWDTAIEFAKILHKRLERK